MSLMPSFVSEQVRCQGSRCCPQCARMRSSCCGMCYAAHFPTRSTVLSSHSFVCSSRCAARAAAAALSGPAGRGGLPGSACTDQGHSLPGPVQGQRCQV